MSLPRLVGISGNLKQPSRTRSLVEAVTAAVARRRDIDLSVYDLLDAGPGLGAAYIRGDLTPDAARVVEAIETADALVVGTPVLTLANAVTWSLVAIHGALPLG